MEMNISYKRSDRLLRMYPLHSNSSSSLFCDLPSTCHCLLVKVQVLQVDLDQVCRSVGFVDCKPCVFSCTWLSQVS